MTKKIVACVISGLFFIGLIVMISLYSRGYFSPFEEILLDTSSAKTEYFLGEEFSSQGLHVEGRKGQYFSNISNFTVDSSEFCSDKVGTYQIKIKYNNLVKNYNVKVISNEEVFIRLFNQIVTDENVKEINTFISYKNGTIFSQWLNDAGYIKENNGETWVIDGQQYTFPQLEKSPFVLENKDEKLTLAQNLYKMEVTSFKDKVESGVIKIESFVMKAGDYYFNLSEGAEKLSAIFNLSKRILTFKYDKTYSSKIDRIEVKVNVTIPPLPENVEWKD